MKKRLLAIILTFPLFVAVSCDDSIKTATFHVYNYSQYQVTEIYVSSVSSENSFKETLEPGGKCTLIGGWVESNTASIPFDFNMNGVEYGCRERGEAATDTRRFIPYKRISDGDTVIVKIYDDHWDY